MTSIKISTKTMNFEELQQDLDDRISAAKVTGFWSVDAKKEWLNQAGQRVCDFRPWEFLKTAKTITTMGEREYYDYPEEFKYNSIYNIKIEDEEYYSEAGRYRKKWDDFQRYKNAGSIDKIFTNHNKWYFLCPVPEDGKTMQLYGLRKWEKLIEDTDEPITPSEFDEAIVRTALASCLRKARRHDEANSHIAEIFSPEGGVLLNLWIQEQDEGPRGYAGTIKSTR